MLSPETASKHLTLAEMEAGLDLIRRAPRDTGTLELIVRRPAQGTREVLTCGMLDLVEGLRGDSWKDRPSSRTADGAAHPDMQLNLMNARVIALLARSKERWALAGDQLFVDLDLSEENLPPGTRLRIGREPVIEVTAQPHLGCKKFVARFGPDAVKFVNSDLGKRLHLRGINARVVRPGEIHAGDLITRA